MPKRATASPQPADLLLKVVERHLSPTALEFVAATFCTRPATMWLKAIADLATVECGKQKSRLRIAVRAAGEPFDLWQST